MRRTLTKKMDPACPSRTLTQVKLWQMTFDQVKTQTVTAREPDGQILFEVTHSTELPASTINGDPTEPIQFHICNPEQHPFGLRGSLVRKTQLSFILVTRQH